MSILLHIVFYFHKTVVKKTQYKKGSIDFIEFIMAQELRIIMDAESNPMFEKSNKTKNHALSPFGILPQEVCSTPLGFFAW